jgi:DNA repair exonuclease SbcCD ATPase subunit
MQLLNKIAFHDSEPALYIQKIEERIKTDTIRLKTLQETFECECQDFQKFLEHHAIQIEHPPNSEEPSNSENLQTLRIEKEELERTLKDLQTRRVKSSSIQAQITLLETREGELERKIADLGERLGGVTAEEVSSREVHLKECQAYVYQATQISNVEAKVKILQKELSAFAEVESSNEKQLHEARSQETQYRDNVGLCKRLGIDYTLEAISKEKTVLQTLLDLQPTIVVRHRIRSCRKRLQELPTEIVTEAEIQEQRQHIYHLEQSQHVLTCPQCGQHLRLKNDQLQISENSPSDRQTIAHERKKLQDLLKRWEIVKERTKISQQIESLESLENLEAEIPAEWTSPLSEKDIQQRKQRLSLLEKITIVKPPEVDLEKIKRGVQKSQLLERLTRLEKELRDIGGPLDTEVDLKTLKSDVEALQKKIQKYKMDLELRQTWQKELQVARSELERLRPLWEQDIDAKYEEVAQCLQSLQKRIERATLIQSSVERREKLHRQRQVLVDLSDRLHTAERLKQIATDVECQVLQYTVDAINTTMNCLAETMFEEPIQIQLKLYKKLKTSKKIKPTVNLEIRYRGGVYESIGQLSGGEGDRLSLLLTLALHRMSDSPLLLFDETFSSLDGPIKDQCLRAIRSVAPTKLVLAVDHQCVEGYYDKVVEVGL